MNPVKRLLLGSGRLSDELRRELAAEGIVFVEEGLTGSVREFRSARHERANEIEGTAGAIVLTPGRLVVWTSRGPHRGKHIDVPLRDGRPMGVDVRADPPERIVFGYEPGRPHPGGPGRIEVHLKTPSAAGLALRLT
ncbi:hypothetical protein [Jiangella anatolica]|uniref:Uncharacterized protein n=1 Tax=Jiangella anatolica TaxID=2670374 RepID=A0A2W2CGY1_9ACTN|nr:hypothetical protein [Jiangella anatolica]PZF79443.1 hypothetical protein C1I92_31085 [Jiangella anatolica]